MAKQIWVNIREARLIEQWLKSSLANATWKQLVDFVWEDAKTIFKVNVALNESELYQKVGWEIEKEAERIVKEKCEPEWNRISEQMKPLGELRNKLAKEKAEVPEDWVWEAEKEAQLNWLDKEMADLSAEYQKVTDGANAELNEFKEKRINEEQWACFFLTEKEYKAIWKYAGF